MHEGGDCLTSGQSYKSLMRLIDSNWDTNISHMRVNEIHSPVLFRFESTTGLGQLKNSTSFTHSSQPQAERPMCHQRRPIMHGVHKT